MRNKDSVTCVFDYCTAQSHVICLAEIFNISTKNKFVIPIQGECPFCGNNMLWSDVIKQKKKQFTLTITDES